MYIKRNFMYIHIKFDSNKCNSKQILNYNKCQFECKNPKRYNARKKIYIWNPATRSSIYKCQIYMKFY